MYLPCDDATVPDIVIRNAFRDDEPQLSPDSEEDNYAETMTGFCRIKGETQTLSLQELLPRSSPPPVRSAVFPRVTASFTPGRLYPLLSYTRSDRPTLYLSMTFLCLKESVMVRPFILYQMVNKNTAIVCSRSAEKDISAYENKPFVIPEEVFRVGASTGDISLLTWLQNTVSESYNLTRDFSEVSSPYVLPDDLGFYACVNGRIETFIWFEKIGFFRLEDNKTTSRSYMFCVNKAISEGSFSLALKLFSITGSYRTTKVALTALFASKATSQDIDAFILGGFCRLQMAEAMSIGCNINSLKYMYEKGYITNQDIALTLRMSAYRRRKTKPYILAWMDEVIAQNLY